MVSPGPSGSGAIDGRLGGVADGCSSRAEAGPRLERHPQSGATSGPQAAPQPEPQPEFRGEVLADTGLRVLAAPLRCRLSDRLADGAAYWDASPEVSFSTKAEAKNGARARARPTAWASASEPPWDCWRVMSLESENGGYACREVAGASFARRYSAVEKAQAVRLVRQLRAELGTDHGTVRRVADQFGMGWSRFGAGCAKPISTRARRPENPPAIRGHSLHDFLDVRLRQPYALPRRLITALDCLSGFSSEP